MPFDQCKDMNVEEIKNTYHVTRSAATTRKEKIIKELKKA